MLKWFMRRRLHVAENRLDTDFAYLKEMLDASPRSFRKFGSVLALASYNEDAPIEAWYAAKIVATLAEDCGPCAQLVITLAERTGVPIAVLEGLLENNRATMGEAAFLGAEFARAVLSHDQKAEELRKQIHNKWGERAVISLALAISISRTFPTLKYALGHGKACQRIRLGNALLQAPKINLLMSLVT